MGSLVVPVLSCSLFFQVLFQLLPCLSNQGFYLLSKHRLIGHDHFVSKGRPIWINQKTKEKESLNHLGYLGGLYYPVYRDYNKPFLRIPINQPTSSFLGGMLLVISTVMPINSSTHLGGLALLLLHLATVTGLPMKTHHASVDHWHPSFKAKTFTSSTLAPSPLPM